MAALVLLCLFIGLPIAEILTFIEVGGRIGGMATIGATIVTAFMGAALFRIQGMKTLARAQASLQNGQMPLEEVVGGLGLLLAAICLFVPGFITDAVGFLLFIPSARLVILGTMLRPLLRRAQVHVSTGGVGPRGGGAQRPAEGRTIEGDYRDVSEQDVDHLALDNDRDGDNPPEDESKR